MKKKSLKWKNKAWVNKIFNKTLSLYLYAMYNLEKKKDAYKSERNIHEISILAIFKTASLLHLSRKKLKIISSILGIDQLTN